MKPALIGAVCGLTWAAGLRGLWPLWPLTNFAFGPDFAVTHVSR